MPENKEVRKLGIFNKSRAKIEILNYIMMCCTKRKYPNINDENTFQGSFLNDIKPPVGTLCILGSAPFSDFYLSWLHSITGDGYDRTYLLESIENGKLCNWSNVSIFWLPKEKVDSFPTWKWDNDQFVLMDKIDKAFKQCGAYILRTMLPEFGEGGSVTLRVRKMFDNDCVYSETFPSYKNMTLKAIKEFYKRAESHNKAIPIHNTK